jgi:type II secretory pathway component PulL
MLPDSSIASILMSLNQIGEGAGLSDVGASSGIGEESGVSLSEALLQQENEISKEVRRRANLTIEKLRLQVSALLNVDEELDINQICNGNSSVRLLLLAIFVFVLAYQIAC